MGTRKYHDAIQEFLDDFAKAGYDHLLTREQEVRLGRLYRSGRYEVLPRDRKCPECGKTIRTHKAWKAHKHYFLIWGGTTKSRDAFWELVACNTRWVVTVARKMLTPGCRLADLIQIGMQGLIHGTTKWDPGRGIRLSTYVTWWIKQAIQKERDTIHLVRIPQYVRELIWHLPRATARLKNRGIPVNDETLCKEMKCTPGQLDAAHIGYKVYRPFTSFEGLSSDEDPISLVKFEPNNSTEATPPDQLLEEEECRELVAKALLAVEEKFGKRAVDVIVFRFGLGDHEAMTLKALGKKLQLSRERIRQIQAKAIRYMAKICRTNPKRASVSTGKVPQPQA